MSFFPLFKIATDSSSSSASSSLQVQGFSELPQCKGRTGVNAAAVMLASGCAAMPRVLNEDKRRDLAKLQAPKAVPHACWQSWNHRLHRLSQGPSEIMHCCMVHLVCSLSSHWFRNASTCTHMYTHLRARNLYAPARRSCTDSVPSPLVTTKARSRSCSAASEI